MQQTLPTFFHKSMIKTYLKEQILFNFGFKPTSDQMKAVEAFADFVLSDDSDKAFILRGYAGTGKTSLVAAFVKTMESLERACVLMAPTGRAAKVLSSYSGHKAYTVHKRIYRQQTSDVDSMFSLGYNALRQSLFIVDEASMISNDGLSGSMYGTGRLLDDLVHFVYGGTGCRLLLIGDSAQLPPVGEEDSPALSSDFMESYGLDVSCVELKTVVRQEDTSGILWNATNIRRMIASEEFLTFPLVRFYGFHDVVNVPGNELIECLGSCYSRDGLDETIVISRSNKRANIYNQGIRNQILYREEELSCGDMLMIAKNNYYWPEQDKDENGKRVCPMDFIANGDIAVVRRIYNERMLYGFRFATCVLTFPDYDDYEMETYVLLDTLHTEAPALTREQNEKLFAGVFEDYSDISTKRERMKKMREDPYFNALQIKYAYAVTCHKAQGGQWTNVFVDQGYVTEDFLGVDYFRWLYTAFTRATGTLYLVNWREEQTLLEADSEKDVSEDDF